MSQLEGRLEDPSVKFREYLAIFRNQKWSIALVSGIVLMVTLFYSFRQPAVYQSQSHVLVKSGAVSPDEFAVTGGPNLETERELAESGAVAAVAADELGQESSDLLQGLSVEWTTNTEILIFKYAHTSPIQAQRRTESFANAYLEYRREQTLDDLLATSDSVRKRIASLNQQLFHVNRRLSSSNDATDKATLRSQAASLAGQVALLQQELADLTPPSRLRVGEVVGPATLPSSPAAPNHLLNIFIGMVSGVSLGAGVALLRERLNDRLRGREDLEVLARAPVLAAVPSVPDWRQRARPVLVTLAQPRSAATEAYKTLRTGLLFAAAERDAHVIMVTSPHAGEGKTVTTSNLGVALAQAGKRVVLISADLRKPRLHHFFGVANHTGLTNVLTGGVSPWQAVTNTRVENLQLMPSGPVPENPAEILGSNAMGKLLSVPSEMADYVLVDAAPVLAVADAATLAPLTDAVLFVVDAQSTHRGAVEQARRQLEQVNGQIIGAVLNNFDPSKASAYSYYRYSYRYEEVEKPQAQAEEGAEPEERTNVLRWRSGTKG